MRFDLPEIAKPADAVAAMSAVLAAVSQGEITPTEGQVVAGIVETWRKTTETEELERRIAILEHAEKRTP